jgi:magnesium and cobalt transporter
MALRTKRLDDVLIPRAEVVAVPVDTPLPELVARFRESGMTRLPVFEGTLDAPLGMIHLKDLALNHGFNGDRDRDLELTALLRPLIYAPPSMPIGVLLTKMQTQRTHMALVIDEYGGVDGLVTLEDLIEQVIGEIEDEHDQEEGKFWRQEKSGCYLALARTPLEDFESEIGFSLAEAEDQEEIDTLGGLVFMLAGRVPARGEVIPHPSGAEIEVVDADPRRIKRLRVRMPQAA